MHISSTEKAVRSNSAPEAETSKSIELAFAVSFSCAPCYRTYPVSQSV
jgi:hypothetical protein